MACRSSGDRGLNDRPGFVRKHSGVAGGGGIAGGAVDVGVDPPVVGKDNVQEALSELDAIKTNKSGDQLSGPLIFERDMPLFASELVNKRYVDGMVIGGPWQTFLVGSGWANNTLRYRQTGDVHYVLFNGSADAELNANVTANVGALTAGYRPSVQMNFPVVLTGGTIIGGLGKLRIMPNGLVELVTYVAMQTLWVSLMFPLH